MCPRGNWKNPCSKPLNPYPMPYQLPESAAFRARLLARLTAEYYDRNLDDWTWATLWAMNDVDDRPKPE